MVDRNDVQALSDSLNETPFLCAKRQEAFDRLQSTSHKNLWLPSSLPLKRGEGVTAAFSLSGDDQKYHDQITADIFAGMATGSIDGQGTELFESRFSSLLDPAKSEALRHYALLTLGFFIYVPPGVQLQHPLKLTYTNTHEWAATHVVLCVGKGAKVTFIEEIYNDQGGIDRLPSRDANGFWSHVSEVFVEDDAELQYVSLQLTDPGERCFIQQRSRVGANAKIAWQNSTVGGSNIQHDLRSEVAGEHAESSVDWVFYAKDEEQQKLTAHNIFNAADGGGEIRMKGVAEEKAHVQCRGFIEIGRAGGGTDTYLTEDVLMLDKTAKVDAVPGLEIKTNDVKASHSAVVTKVTPENLFYFAARGIPERVARQMYVQGFLSDLTQRIASEDVRTVCRESIARKYERV